MVITDIKMWNCQPVHKELLTETRKKMYLRLRQRKTPLQESDQCAETCNTTKIFKLF